MVLHEGLTHNVGTTGTSAFRMKAKVVSVRKVRRVGYLVTIRNDADDVFEIEMEFDDTDMLAYAFRAMSGRLS